MGSCCREHGRYGLYSGVEEGSNVAVEEDEMGGGLMREVWVVAGLLPEHGFQVEWQAFSVFLGRAESCSLQAIAGRGSLPASLDSRCLG